jgi:DNA segregation ATPase FtsK/SpoIIIE-like protein
VSVELLTERSNLLIQARVRSIEDYNRKREVKDWLRPVVVVVDEFADLGDQVHDDRRAREEFYTNIRQIAQAGRNRGVHLVLCTQRPTTDLIPGSIKSQMNARVALKMNAALDSRIILDQDGAERLLGKGDLLFKDPGTLERLQGFRCDAEEVEHFLEDLK